MRAHETYFRRYGCKDTAETARLDDGKPLRPHNTIRDLVGEAGWWRLASAVRQRFGSIPAPEEHWRFHGSMHRVDMTLLGRVMAWASRAIGAPVAHRSGRNIPIDVYVYSDKGGTAWERHYHFPNAEAITARTVKRIDGSGRMLECFGMGFGMELDVYEADAALHFRSTSFYLDIGEWRLRLPRVLSPGTLLVEHIDEGEGEFRFRMTVEHDLFGRVFFQDGVFRKVEA